MTSVSAVVVPLDQQTQGIVTKSHQAQSIELLSPALIISSQDAYTCLLQWLQEVLHFYPVF